MFLLLVRSLQCTVKIIFVDADFNYLQAKCYI